jgi:hypothetical protein
VVIIALFVVVVILALVMIFVSIDFVPDETGDATPPAAEVPARLA